MNKAVVIIAIIIAVLGGGYLLFSGQKVAEEKAPAETAMVSDTEEEIAESARYRLEFTALWSQESHPDNYVSNAHFSPFVAYSHNNSQKAKIFEKGQVPTAGIEEMAETGATEKLNQEIEAIIASGQAFKKTQGNVFDSPGSDTSELEFSRNFQYLTFVSMMAPSPDWFVAKTESLIKEGKWVDTIELALITYDAGSDNGETLTAEDNDTDPKEPVSIFAAYLQGLGKITLTRLQ